MKLVATANWGMLAYRNNEIEVGRTLYESAIEGFRALKLSESELLARLYYARESIFSGDASLGKSSLQQAVDMNKAQPRKHLVPQIARVVELLHVEQSKAP